MIVCGFTVYNIIRSTFIYFIVAIAIKHPLHITIGVILFIIWMAYRAEYELKIKNNNI